MEMSHSDPFESKFSMEAIILQLSVYGLDELRENDRAEAFESFCFAEAVDDRVERFHWRVSLGYNDFSVGNRTCTDRFWWNQRKEVASILDSFYHLLELLEFVGQEASIRRQGVFPCSFCDQTVLLKPVKTTVDGRT